MMMPIGCTVSIHHVWSIEAVLVILGASKMAQVQSVQNGTTKIRVPNMCARYARKTMRDDQLKSKTLIRYFCNSNQTL